MTKLTYTLLALCSIQAATLSLDLAQPLPASAQNIPSSLGWYEIPNTRIRPLCPNPAQFPGINLNSDCHDVTTAWSGGTFDTTRNRLMIQGGGHNGYAGNEIYVLDMDTLSMSRLYDPSINPPTSCGNNGLMPDGKPQGYHTNNQMAYIPSVDKMLLNEGSNVPCGGTNGKTFLFDPKNNQWANLEHPGVTISNSGSSFGLNTVYDPNRALVFARATYVLYAFNPTTNTWAALSGQDPNTPPNVDYKQAIIDTKRKRYLYQVPGVNKIFYYDISPTSSYTVQSFVPSSCDAFINSTEDGWQYDSFQDRYVAWVGGNSVIVMHPDTGACSSIAFSGSPGPALSNGTYGRFQYVTSMNLFVVCNDIDNNCFTLRMSSAGGGTAGDTTPPSTPGNLNASAISSQINLSWSASTDNIAVTGYKIFRNGTQLTTTTSATYTDNGLQPSTTYTYTVSAFDGSSNSSSLSSPAIVTTSPATSSNDFTTRCGAAGVLVCLGWDQPSDFTPAVWPASGLYPNDAGIFSNATLDASIKLSGTGSLRYRHPAGQATSNTVGQWRQEFGQNFAQNSHFYIQFAMRISPEFATNTGSWNSMWKSVIFHRALSSCGQIELTTVNYNFYKYPKLYPIMYTGCGTPSLNTQLDAKTFVSGTSTFLMEQSASTTSGYRCQFNLETDGTGNGSGCFNWSQHLNQWVTFYYDIQIGTWGTSTSVVKAYLSFNGGPYLQWINVTNLGLSYDSSPGPTVGYDTLTLTPYMTNLSTPASADALMWYDDLIISTMPIVAPGGAGGSSNPPPAAPTNLTVQ